MTKPKKQKVIKNPETCYHCGDDFTKRDWKKDQQKIIDKVGYKNYVQQQENDYYNDLPHIGGTGKCSKCCEINKVDKDEHKKLLLSGLNEFFYNNQYDEDRFPTFRCMDRHEDIDYQGNKFYYYEIFD